MSDISLHGFQNLDASELDLVNKLVLTNLKKLKTDYELLSLKLKQHKHTTRIIHELYADLFFSKGKSIAAESNDANLYKALDQVFLKLISEIKHRFKK